MNPTYAYDPRDLIDVLEMIYGTQEEDFTKSLYRAGYRYPITDFSFRYINGEPVLDTLLPLDIVSADSDIIATADEISNGIVKMTPFYTKVAPSVVRDILYTIMYFSSPDRSLFFNDPLGISDYPLIPHFCTGNSLTESIVDILNITYGENHEKSETFLSFFSSEMTKRSYEMFNTNQVYSIDIERNIFILTPKGTPREFRYDLGLIQNRINI